MRMMGMTKEKMMKAKSGSTSAIALNFSRRSARASATFSGVPSAARITPSLGSAWAMAMSVRLRSGIHEDRGGDCPSPAVVQLLTGRARR